MTDRDALARYPQPGYQQRQFSSCNYHDLGLIVSHCRNFYRETLKD